MEKRTRVVVYGSSLNMACIAASLKAETDLDVVCVDPHSPTARKRLSEISPAVIAFDLNDPFPGLYVTLMRERPGLLLIGVDPSSDALLVLSSYPQQALNVADLVKVIHRKGSNYEPPVRRKDKNDSQSPSQKFHQSAAVL